MVITCISVGVSGQEEASNKADALDAKSKATHMDHHGFEQIVKWPGRSQKSCYSANMCFNV